MDCINEHVYQIQWISENIKIEVFPLLYFLQTHGLANTFVIGYFVVQKVWKAYNKFFQVNQREKVMKTAIP